MIFVRRDMVTIPKMVIDVAVRAQTQLEKLTTTADRNAFIKKKSHIWRAFGRYLSKMSYGKCWYSETLDSHSFYDVDHFRPKAEAKRSEEDVEPGYDWLAFSWENFRYSANCSNRLSKNEETGETDGKGSWFPLLAGSVKASWDSRCETDERPVLLDPVVKKDVRLIEVESDGRIVPSRAAIGSGRDRVTRSCQLYGLNLPGIKSARLRLIRDINDLVKTIEDTIVAAGNPAMPSMVADLLPLDDQLEIIRKKTKPDSPYSRTARCALRRAGWGDLCACHEESESDEAA